MTAEETLKKIKTLFERDEKAEVVEKSPGHWECPKCGLTTSGIWLYEGMTFCPGCGQRLKWR